MKDRQFHIYPADFPCAILPLMCHYLYRLPTHSPRLTAPSYRRIRYIPFLFPVKLQQFLLQSSTVCHLQFDLRK